MIIHNPSTLPCEADEPDVAERVNPPQMAAACAVYVAILRATQDMKTLLAQGEVLIEWEEPLSAKWDARLMAIRGDLQLALEESRGIWS